MYKTLYKNMFPWQIQARNALVIPDLHQNLQWFQAILDKEKGNYDYIIFLGDFFDKKSDDSASYKETAQFMIELQNGVYGPNTQLLGNHDQHYMEAWKANQKYQRHKGSRYECGGFSNNRSIDINKLVTFNNWKKCELFCEFGGYVLSHAGIHQSFWDFSSSFEENLNLFYNESRSALDNIAKDSSRLLAVGRARGGYAPVGGLTWLDFTDEFQNNISLPPQIVGHTRSVNIARYKGNNWCIDGGQTIYGLLSFDGNFIVKSLKDNHLKEEESEWKYNGWV